MRLMYTCLLRSRKHPENIKQTLMLGNKKGKSQGAVCHQKPLLQHEGLHMMCRTFHHTDDTAPSEYQAFNQNPHRWPLDVSLLAASCFQSIDMAEWHGCLDVFPSLILNFGILIAWKVRNCVFVSRTSVWPETCGAQRKLRLLWYGLYFCHSKPSLFFFTGFDSEMAKRGILMPRLTRPQSETFI